jgi:hypothetical protein
MLLICIGLLNLSIKELVQLEDAMTFHLYLLGSRRDAHRVTQLKSESHIKNCLKFGYLTNFITDLLSLRINDHYSRLLQKLSSSK